LTAEVSPSNTNDADKAITWSTSDSAVATVTDGVVTWVGEGEAIITATAAGKNASGQEVSASVTVQAASAPEAPKLVVFNQAATPADGTTTTLPQLNENGRYVINNNNTTAVFSSAVLPNEVWRDNLLVYLDTPITGDFTMDMRLNIRKFNGEAGDGAWSGAWIGAFNDPTMTDFTSAAVNSWGFVGARKVYSGDDRMLITRESNTGSGTAYPTNNLYNPNNWAYEYIYTISRSDTTYTIQVRNSKTGEVMAQGERATASNYTTSLQGDVYLGVMITNCEIEISNFIVTQEENVVYQQTSSDPGFTPVPLTDLELSVTGAISGAGVDYLNPITAIPASGIDVKATLTPVNTTDDIVWSLAGDNAIIDQTGHVTVNAIGEFTVTATSGGISDSFSFNIIADYDPVESVTVSGDTQVNVDSSITLEASVLPLTAKNEVYWSSSDETKATVDPETGLVTGVAEGEVTIIATSYDGIGGSENPVTGEYPITVVAPKTLIWQWIAGEGDNFSGNNAQTINGMSVIRTGGTVSSSSAGLEMGGARWVLGYNNPSYNTGTATANNAYVTNAELDLTQPFKITVEYSSATGSGNFYVYLNNNTSSGGSGVITHTAFGSKNTIIGGVNPPESTGGEVVIMVNPATDLALTSAAENAGLTKAAVLAHSFLQFRCESGVSSMLISKITIEPWTPPAAE
jgi:uncharacterized protein YjdB